MQPTTTPKPVMDVTAPKPTATPQPAAPAALVLAVHQAPTTEVSHTNPDNDKSATAEKSAADVPSPKASEEPAHNKTDKPTPQKSAAASHSNPSPTPVGAILGAVVVMLVLSAIAIAIYLKA